MTEDVDPLDAYMALLQPELQHSSGSLQKTEASEIVSDEEDVAPVKQANSQPELKIEDLVNAQKVIANAQLKITTGQLERIKKERINSYLEIQEIKKMTREAVHEFRQTISVKVRGVNISKPIKEFSQAGLSHKMSLLLKKLEIIKPTPIQSQVLPIAMSGRDVLAIASTGSGKTLAYLLPLFRHMMARSEHGLAKSSGFSSASGEGPLGLIIAPTRELALQIMTTALKFSKLLGFKSLCTTGGSELKAQIAEVKKGIDLLIATPGRLLELLTVNGGKMMTLNRTSFLVVDEADRMFDLGFEPQVMRVISFIQANNCPYSCQIGFFSATFPKSIETVGRRILTNPIEVIAGGRTVVCGDIVQKIELISSEHRFMRLLEILGMAFSPTAHKDAETAFDKKLCKLGKNARVLIFVDRQEAADSLFKDLIRRGYLVASIHGGKDQEDRESSLTDFKKGTIPIMCATSLAARGLDVKELNLVINYDPPNHLEDYVHRVGRTGRAGRSGLAVTFIDPQTQDYLAPDMVKALADAGYKKYNEENDSLAVIQEDLIDLADAYQDKIAAGHQQNRHSGFGGKGLDRIDKEREMTILAQKHAFSELYDVDDDTNEAVLESFDGEVTLISPLLKKVKLPEAANVQSKLLEAVKKINEKVKDVLPDESRSNPLATINARFGITSALETGNINPIVNYENGESIIIGYRCELDINDFPQYSRWKVTSKEVFQMIQELTGVSLTVRGAYIPPSSKISLERRIHICIEGESETAVILARDELLKILKETTEEAVSKGLVEQYVGRYTVNK